MKMSRMKFVFVVISMLVLGYLSVKESTAKNYDLSESEASKIITQHFKDYYGDIALEVYRYRQSTQADEFNDRRQAFEVWKKTGLIDYKTFLTDAFVKTLGIQAMLTDKGHNTYHISYEKNDKIIGFIVGKREIAKIIKIDSNNETVYFSYIYEPNEIGTVLGYEEAKYRGKAKIVYDPFLERYIFKGMMFSMWDVEKWHLTNWSYEIKGEKVYSIRTGTE